MPRDGSGIYSIPPGTQGAPDTTIESAKYNAYIADIEVDLNAVRPIIAGGTGSNSAAGTRDAIDAERSMQVVTNFDSMVWEAGSFYSAAGATNAPVAGHAFAGIAYGSDANNLVIEARDLNDTNTPGLVYVREKLAGVWSAWTQDVDLSIVNTKVAKAGDTMTGDLTIQKSGPSLVLNATDASAMVVQAQRSALKRWLLAFGMDAESGANSGSNINLMRYNDAGVFMDAPLVVNRASGLASVIGNPTAALGVATKQYVDTGDAAASASASNRVLKAGDTMTGALTFSGAPTQITFNVGATDSPYILANRANGVAAGNRWEILLATGNETGGNVGGAMAFAGFNDAGSYIGNPLTLNRKAPYVQAISLQVSDTANATSSTTGAMACAGGIGLGGNSWSTGEFCSNTFRIGTAPENYTMSRSGSDGWLEFRPTQITFSGYRFFVWNGSGMAIGFHVTNAGTLRAGGYTAGTLVSDASGNISVSSDERLKTIIAPFTRGLDALRQIGGADVFSLKHEAETHPNQRYAGFIAQKVQRAIPEAVNEGWDGMLALDDRPLIATLMNAVLELADKVEQLSGETKWRKT